MYQTTDTLVAVPALLVVFRKGNGTEQASVKKKRFPYPLIIVNMIELNQYMEPLPFRFLFYYLFILYFLSHLLYGMCENLHYESVYFKELHNDQEYY